MAAAAIGLLLWVAPRPGARRVLIILLALAALAFGLTGLRASWFAAQALDPALEGRDVTVTGVVADMPQRSETGLRFRLEGRIGGRWADRPCGCVPQLYLGWFGGPVPDAAGRMELLRQAPRAARRRALAA